jgi:hypothetical protein
LALPSEPELFEPVAPALRLEELDDLPVEAAGLLADLALGATAAGLDVGGGGEGGVRVAAGAGEAGGVVVAADVPAAPDAGEAAAADDAGDADDADGAARADTAGASTAPRTPTTTALSGRLRRRLDTMCGVFPLHPPRVKFTVFVAARALKRGSVFEPHGLRRIALLRRGGVRARPVDELEAVRGVVAVGACRRRR